MTDWTDVPDFEIEDLSAHIEMITLIARWHFKQWGNLTSAITEDDYKAFFIKNASAKNFPATLITVNHGRLLGSASLISCDMDIRCELKPWLTQLYVDPPERGRGIGSALVRAAIERARKQGFGRLYLYTSGTLPAFYERIGWIRRETVYYKERDRVLMEIEVVPYIASPNPQ